MSGDRMGSKKHPQPSGITPKTWGMMGLAAVLLVVLAWAWWPTPVKVDPAAQQALDAMKNDKDANPPVADVPPPTDGPRRKATKGK